MFQYVYVQESATWYVLHLTTTPCWLSKIGMEVWTKWKTED